MKLRRRLRGPAQQELAAPERIEAGSEGDLLDVEPGGRSASVLFDGRVVAVTVLLLELILL